MKPLWGFYLFEKDGSVRGGPSKSLDLRAFHCLRTSNPPRANFPPPPVHFLGTPEVDSMISRYERHLLGFEPLLSMAQFILTRIEALSGATAGRHRKSGSNATGERRQQLPFTPARAKAVLR
jgi:hypothetical protein